jgi:hypothetical protein
MELLDCIIAGGLLLVLLSFLLRLLKKKGNFEGLQELHSAPAPNPIKSAPKIKDSNPTINLSQYPKQKIMDPPPSLKGDYSKISKEMESSVIPQNIPNQDVSSSSLQQQPAPQNIHLVN